MEAQEKVRRYEARLLFLHRCQMGVLILWCFVAVGVVIYLGMTYGSSLRLLHDPEPNVLDGPRLRTQAQPEYTDPLESLPSIYVVEAIRRLRDIDRFKWYIVPLFILVLYLYFDHYEYSKYSKMLAAVGFILMDWFVEILNCWLFKKSGMRAALWTTAWGSTSFQVLIGWNIEIIIGFLIAGLASTKPLSRLPTRAYFFGTVNNRAFWALFFSMTHLLVEYALNELDLLIWDLWWWRASFPWLLMPIGYVCFYCVSYSIYDAKSMTTKFAIVIVLLLVDVAFTTWGYLEGWV